MIGGLSGTGRLAIAAIFCAVGGAAGLEQRAEAADLGGDCCADLEERVADLEATTVRKGNKKVSVQLYGKVNYATMWWNDGGEQNVYVVNNYNESTRTGFRGKAKIADGWDAGFRLEWEYRPAASSLLNQFNDNNQQSSAADLVVRWSQMYLASKAYGTLNWGLTGTPKYDITKGSMEYVSTIKGEGGGLSDTMTSDFRMNPSFRLRPTGFNNAEGLSSLTWSNIARCYSSSDQYNCSTRRNGVAYSTPEFKGLFDGFNVQWGWFEDDDWGAALRYKNTFNDTWMLAAGVAYENFRDERLQAGGGGVASGPIIIPPSTTKQTFFQRNFDEWAGSAAVKHKPSGLFAMGNFSTSESDDTNVIGFYTGNKAPDMSAWDVQAGIQKKFWAPGETAFWGGYGQVNDGWAPGSNGNGGNLGGIAADSILRAGTFASVTVPTEIVGSEVDRWFLGLDQGFESAAMHLYLVYQHFNADLSLVTRDPSVSPNGKLKNVPVSIDDFDLIYSGGRIYF
ncbi:porin [Methyloceanibacter sp.]|uniref:porin n=1 Tax=Methyloceanibacter sp. TaxID=1965321 RepID=UPI003D6D6E9E